MKIIFGVLAFAICVGYGLALTPGQVTQIDALIRNVVLPQFKITGLGISIVQNGQTALSRGYGQRNVGQNMNVTGNTLFSIGSITKSFTAVLVVKTLHEKFPELGEYALDVPVSVLAPGFNFTFGDRYRWESINFRDLLAHRTCLTALDASLIFAAFPTKAEYIYRTRYNEQGCNYRTGWIYNNEMYTLAGSLIAHIAQSSIEKMMLDLMSDLGMRESTIVKVTGDFQLLEHMSQAYTEYNDNRIAYNMSLLKRVDMAMAAGGILASSNDMAKYMLFHLNKGRVGNVQVVPEEVIQWMYVSSYPFNALTYRGAEGSGNRSVTGDHAYALGLQLSLYDGYSLIGHGGYWPPFASHMFLVPSLNNFGVFTSSNGPGATVPHVGIQIAILDIILGVTQQRPISEDLFPLSATLEKNSWKLKKNENIDKDLKVLLEKKKRPLAPLAVEDLVGVYGLASAGDIHITLEAGNTLRMRWGEWGIGTLAPIGGSEVNFTINWETDIMDHFYTYGPPYADFSLNFEIEDHVIIQDHGVPQAMFEKDATLITFPEIPWPADSCGPVVP